MIGKDSRILVIGAGPGGIISAYQFREAGYTNVKVLERDGDVGGTWQRSRYPGLSCDVMIHAYSFSFNLNPSWPRSYASQPEILEYMRATVDKLDLWPMIHLNTGVTGATWHDDAAEWVVTTSTGETLVADVVISAQGMFGEVRLPDIAGRDTFAGTLIHTGEWPHDLDITNKRVAVIGGAGDVLPNFETFFTPDFFIPSWRRLILGEHAPLTNNISQSHLIEKSNLPVEQKIQVIDDSLHVIEAMQNSQHFPDGCHPGTWPHQDLFDRLVKANLI
jgi:hypothetical protein